VRPASSPCRSSSGLFFLLLLNFLFGEDCLPLRFFRSPDCRFDSVFLPDARSPLFLFLFGRTWTERGSPFFGTKQTPVFAPPRTFVLRVFGPRIIDPFFSLSFFLPRIWVISWGSMFRFFLPHSHQVRATLLRGSQGFGGAKVTRAFLLFPPQPPLPRSFCVASPPFLHWRVLVLVVSVPCRGYPLCPSLSCPFLSFLVGKFPPVPFRFSGGCGCLGLFFLRTLFPFFSPQSCRSTMSDFLSRVSRVFPDGLVLCFFDDAASALLFSDLVFFLVTHACRHSLLAPRIGLKV